MPAEAVSFLISIVADEQYKSEMAAFLLLGIGIYLPLLLIAFCQMKENEVMFKEQGVTVVCFLFLFFFSPCV
jgi:hypothetical protein